jgi:hypothetical protein
MLCGTAPKSDRDLYDFMDPMSTSKTFSGAFSLERFQITGTVEQFYDYGLLGIRNFDLDLVEDATEWTFAYGLIVDIARSALVSESLNGRGVNTEKCRQAADAFFARMVLDGFDRPCETPNETPDGVLSISEVALLAGLDERTVRNATVKSATNRLGTTLIESSIYIPREAAVEWLSNKRGFTPTRVGDALPAGAVLASDFVSLKEAGDFVRQELERKQFSHSQLVAKVGPAVDTASLKALEKGEVTIGEEGLTAIGSALGLDGPLFALRIIEVNTKNQLMNLARRIQKLV